MLKLPKGLKKKKKGKKSKKDQELFTEEELEQYKREQRAKQEAALEAAKSDVGESDGASDVEKGSTSGSVASSAHPVENSGTSGEAAAATNGTSSTVDKTENDEEWAKFKALTSGVDSVLHKTQQELDHIKQTSFYQRLPSAAEKKKQEEEEAAAREAARLAEERRLAEEKEANRDKLAEAVVELSESEEESEEVGDIFATDYIDAITSGELQLGVVPDSPELEIDEGPDPFDTAYAEKVIVGADKAKGGKKLVSLGAAVEVLTGRVDRDHAVALSGAKRKPRKGVQDLLLDESIDLEAVATEVEAVSATPEPTNLLDELADDIPNDVPIDLTASLHLQFLKKPKVEDEYNDEEEEGLGGFLPEREPAEGAEDLPPSDIVAEFDVLKYEEDDEFAELAAESLTKKEEVKVITQVPVPIAVSGPIEGDWAEFEQTPNELEQTSTGGKVKPPRPAGPPPRPTSGPHIAPGVIHLSDDDDFALEDDPFDTTFVEKVVTAQEDDDDDFDFDPRAEERKAPVVPPPPKKILQRDLFNTNFADSDVSSNLLGAQQKDLLAGSTTDLSAVGAAPIAPIPEPSEEDFDPFDTSAVSVIVQPKEVELKVLEKELLQDSKLKHSLSDPDFDPRAEEEPATPVAQIQTPSEPFDPARRKSSLSLNLQSKTVGFLVPKNQDLLGANNDGGKVQKPLTPYYAKSESIPEKDNEDPFDTSFVPANKPSEVELKNLEQDLLTSNLKHSLSDPDFDPRAPPTPVAPADLLGVQENINIKVLTPAQESKDIVEEPEAIIDPFDTSIAANIAPGKAELKVIEDELLPAQTPEITTGVLDTLTDAQELGLGDKVLTPQLTRREVSTPEDIDPFDTSIAENLAPGQTEIKLLENELIER
ncbi:protein stoned-A [Eupeodes corollae]|uniref:protein stoned-A n=1 Tax=Eupeodes corollae TaxID=290404 RepID=UPI00249175A6|nr:protein stoned-A [Eupeodes corollae]XP_055910031.1 protein stoned-A [Eupeodes corollae]